jgi:DNA repair protein RecN (Recombination protein N)
MPTFGSGKHVVEAALAKGAKTGEAERTVVRVLPLSPSDRREELAQLAGGESAPAIPLLCESLLSQADSIRENFDVW